MHTAGPSVRRQEKTTHARGSAFSWHPALLMPHLGLPNCAIQQKPNLWIFAEHVTLRGKPEAERAALCTANPTSM
eukprot:1158208-Pelagomonas_calceolata.AAC.51